MRLLPTNKSPSRSARRQSALVAPGVISRTAAKRIAHGKAFSAAQVCVAPDYALVPRDRVDAFVAEVAAAFKRGTHPVQGNADYT